MKKYKISFKNFGNSKMLPMINLFAELFKMPYRLTLLKCLSPMICKCRQKKSVRPEAPIKGRIRKTTLMNVKPMKK